MSYFEIKNPQSRNYASFKKVGDFYVPKEIQGGSIGVAYKGKVYGSSILTDLSRQCSNDLFLSAGSKGRDKVLEFILSRLENEAVISCLVGFIEPEKIINVIGDVSLNASNLVNLFEDFPKIGVCVKIKGKG
ncbi:MAG: hypothetical protein P0Y51_08225 [Candidatus Pseudomonas colombiensis]|nr:MAG: hypothetical protein P0Y51_08225 [Pseudomonas sp.]